MHFAFTDEQIMIRDSAESFLMEVSTSQAVRAAMATDTGYDPDVWRSICHDLGWQSTLIPEAHGGLGLGIVELVALQEQMGRFLLCSPFYATVCLGITALLVAGTEAQQAEYLPKINAGTTATLAFAGAATAQQGGQWDAAAVDAVYEHQDDHFILNG
ncbi:MAG: acyl-CoA dehydrogenase family protein, partial [Pseudomonadota bacterium]